MPLRSPYGALRPRTLDWPSRTPSRALHASSALHSRYRGLFKHGTLRQWALRTQEKELDKWRTTPKSIPPAAKTLMRRADALIATTLKKQGVLDRPADRVLLHAADALVNGAKRSGNTGRTQAERDIDAASLREALRLYHLAGMRANGMLPVLGSRIIGVSSLLAHRMYRAADRLDRVMRTPPVALHDTVGWGLREPRAPSEPVPASEPPADRNDADPLPTDDSAPSLYKRRTLSPLPSLPLSRAEHARLPLMRAFPGIGGSISVSLAHGKTATPSLPGPSRPNPHRPIPHVRLNPVVGVGEHQHFVRRHRAARPFPTTASGSHLKWFSDHPKYLACMVPYYLSTPAPPPPPPPPEGGAWEGDSLAQALRARLGGRVRH